MSYKKKHLLPPTILSPAALTVDTTAAEIKQTQKLCELTIMIDKYNETNNDCTGQFQFDLSHTVGPV